MKPDISLATYTGHFNLLTTMDETKQSYPVGFDRCSPSILAFAHRESAERFVQEHGGKLRRFAELAASSRQ